MYTAHQILLSRTGRACCKHGKEDNWTQILSANLAGRQPLEYADVGVAYIKMNGNCVSAAFIWIRNGAYGDGHKKVKLCLYTPS